MARHRGTARTGHPEASDRHRLTGEVGVASLGLFLGLALFGVVVSACVRRSEFLSIALARVGEVVFIAEAGFPWHVGESGLVMNYSPRVESHLSSYQRLPFIGSPSCFEWSFQSRHIFWRDWSGVSVESKFKRISNRWHGSELDRCGPTSDRRRQSPGILQSHGDFRIGTAPRCDLDMGHVQKRSVRDHERLFGDVGAQRGGFSVRSPDFDLRFDVFQLSVSETLLRQSDNRLLVGRSGVLASYAITERGGAELQHAHHDQEQRKHRHPVVRVSDALIYLVLAISAFCFGLLFVGGFLWGSDGNLNRLWGLFSISTGATGFGLMWLWLFGWL